MKKDYCVGGQVEPHHSVGEEYQFFSEGHGPNGPVVEDGATFLRKSPKEFIRMVNLTGEG